MYTQCPECHARFRVGADDLSAAGGTVRCGRCGSAFNALARLSDTVPFPHGYTAEGSAPDDAADLEASTGPVTGVEFHFTADDIESVFVHSNDRSGRRRGLRDQDLGAVESQAFAAEPADVVVGENQPFEDITLEGERISIESILGIDTDESSTDARSTGQASTEHRTTDEDSIAEILLDDDTIDEEDPTDEFEVLRDVPGSLYPEDEDDSWAGPAVEVAAGAAIATVAPAEAAAEAPRSARVVAWPAPPPRSTAAARRTPRDEASLAAALAPESTRLRPSGRSLAWSIGCLVVALALLAQVTHQFRQDLVRRPQIGPLLKDVYARIGVPLSPNWELDAFELRQWGSGGGADANGRLTVRASLTNRANFAQPHPILRLELDDRFGDSVAVRAFEPAEYLKNPAQATRLLAPGASAEAELVIVDPGEDAVGYQLDVCLRESATVLRCAKSPG